MQNEKLKRSLKKLITIIIQICIIAIVATIVIFTAVYAYRSSIYVFHLFTNIRKEVLASLIATSGTVIVSVLTVMLSKYYEKKRQIAQEIRESKIPIYKDFIEFLFRMFNFSKNPDKKVKEDEMLEFLTDFTQKMIIWGSDEVLYEWQKFKNLNTPNSNLTKLQSLELLRQVEKILYAIRKDVGHNNKKLKQDTLLSLFINDLDKVKFQLNKSKQGC